MPRRKGVLVQVSAQRLVNVATKSPALQLAVEGRIWVSNHPFSYLLGYVGSMLTGHDWSLHQPWFCAFSYTKSFMFHGIFLKHLLQLHKMLTVLFYDLLYTCMYIPCIYIFFIYINTSYQTISDVISKHMSYSIKIQTYHITSYHIISSYSILILNTSILQNFHGNPKAMRDDGLHKLMTSTAQQILENTKKIKLQKKKQKKKTKKTLQKNKNQKKQKKIGPPWT